MVLFSEEVHTLTFLDLELAEKLSDALAKAESTSKLGVDARVPEHAKRLVSYFNFIKDTHHDLSLLKSEGILKPVVIENINEIGAIWKDIPFFNQLNEMNEADQKRLLGLVEESFSVCPPAYSDIALLCLVAAIVDGKVDASVYADQAAACRVAHCIYLLSLIVIAEKKGVGLSTWLPACHNALLTSRELFANASEKRTSKLQARKMVEASLGKIILERHLPSADDLPMIW